MPGAQLLEGMASGTGVQNRVEAQLWSVVPKEGGGLSKSTQTFGSGVHTSQEWPNTGRSG